MTTNNPTGNFRPPPNSIWSDCLGWVSQPKFDGYDRSSILTNSTEYPYTQKNKEVILLDRNDVDNILHDYFNTLKLSKEIPEIRERLIELQVLVKLYTIDEKYIKRNE